MASLVRLLLLISALATSFGSLARAQQCSRIFDPALEPRDLIRAAEAAIEKTGDKTIPEGSVVEEIPRDQWTTRTVGWTHIAAIPVARSPLAFWRPNVIVVRMRESDGRLQSEIDRDPESIVEVNRLTDLRLAEAERMSPDFARRDLRLIRRHGLAAEAMNQREIQRLRDEAPPPARGQRIQEVPMALLEELYRKTDQHAIVGRKSRMNYDLTGDNGFCWGRAMAAHLEALRSGVAKESIRKVWFVGTLKTANESWSFHVSTLVRGEDGVWYAIDPFINRPVTLEQWLQTMKRYDAAGDARLIVTDASRYSVLNDLKYLPDLARPASFENKVFNGYFSDLLAEFRRESAEVAARIQSIGPNLDTDATSGQ